MTSSSGAPPARSAERGVDGVEEAVARAGVVASSPGCRASAAPAWRSASANGSNGASGSSEQRPSRTVRAVGERRGGELVREPRLADARLAGEQHDPPVAVHLHAAPTTARRRSSSARRPTNSVACARASAGGGATGAAVAAPQLVEQRARLARRRRSPSARAGARRSARPRPARRRGRRPRRAARSAGGWAPRRAGRARPARASGGPPRPGSARRRELLERLGEPLRVRLARLVRPVVVEAVEDRRAARRRARAAGSPRASAASNARVSTQAVAVERDRLARGDDVVGGRAERAPQLGQRGAQAGAGRLVEHVGPEARGEPARAACGPGCSAR